MWSAGWTKAVADVGLRKMVELLVGSGVFYHLYNQVGTSCSSRPPLL
jgi:hypothetical protein